MLVYQEVVSSNPLILGPHVSTQRPEGELLGGWVQVSEGVHVPPFGQEIIEGLALLGRVPWEFVFATGIVEVDHVVRDVEVARDDDWLAIRL